MSVYANPNDGFPYYLQYQQAITVHSDPQAFEIQSTNLEEGERAQIEYWKEKVRILENDNKYFKFRCADLTMQCDDLTKQCNGLGKANYELRINLISIGNKLSFLHSNVQCHFEETAQKLEMYEKEFSQIKEINAELNESNIKLSERVRLYEKKREIETSMWQLTNENNSELFPDDSTLQ